MTSTDDKPVAAAIDVLGAHGVEHGSGVLVALSGGADSTALLLVLKTISKSWFPLELHAAYIDHNLRSRSELDNEIEHIVTLCVQIGVPLHIGTIPIGEISDRAASDGAGVEAAARKLRYGWLEQFRNQFGLSWIATGHHLDDQAETLIMRFMQGGSAAGMSGIREVNGQVIRPLLMVSREDLRAFLTGRGVRWVEDSSNREGAYLRNRVRTELVPVISSIFPGYRAALRAYSERAAAVDRVVERETHRLIAWQQTDRGLLCEAESFFAAGSAVRLTALYAGLTLIKSSSGLPSEVPVRVPYRFLRPALFARRQRGGRSVTLLRGYGLVLSLHADFLFWGVDIVHPDKSGYLLLVPEHGWATLHLGARTLQASLETGTGEQGYYTVSLQSRDVRFPVLVRSRRPGDEISTAAGTKSVKKLLSDLNVPTQWRDDVPLVVDSDGVLALLAAPFGGATVLAQRAAVPGVESGYRTIKVQLR